MGARTTSYLFRGSHFSLFFYLSVISALVPLLSLPLTAQIAFGMYLLPSS